MTVSARASFDVSNYITRPTFLTKPAPTLLYFTPSRHQSDAHGKLIAGLPGYGQSPNCLPVYVGANFFVRLPRGIPYSEFPIAADPHYLDKDPDMGHHPRSGTVSLSYNRIVEAMAEQPYFVYDESGYVEHLDVHEVIERRFDAGQVYRKIGMGKPIYARLDGKSAFEEVSLDDLERGSAGLHRLHYSYKVNFRAIGLKALEHILARYPMPDFTRSSSVSENQCRQYIHMQQGYRRSQISSLDDPWSLQILYMLRSLTSEEERFLAQMDYSGGLWFQRFSQMRFGNRIEKGNWVGTGKYAARFPVMRCFGRAFFPAIALGLVTPNQSGKVSLTEAGHAFLNTMHTDNIDPDAIIRFMDPTTMTIPASEIERVDAWMMRFFRKMKTKVNAL